MATSGPIGTAKIPVAGRASGMRPVSALVSASSSVPLASKCQIFSMVPEEVIAPTTQNSTT